VFGRAFMVIHTLANGKIAKQMVTESTNGRMGTDTRESGATV